MKLEIRLREKVEHTLGETGVDLKLKTICDIL